MIAGTLKRLLRPTVWVTAERVFGEVFALALFAVQARLLGPAAFGLVAAVMVFISFWDSIPNVAAIEALVSVRRIEDRHYATAAAVMMLAGLAFGAAVFAAAGPMAALFGDAELAPVMRALALLPLLQAIAIVPIAATRRELRFRTTTLRTIISLLAGGAVGLGLALAGLGVWALVWQALVQRLVAAVVMWSIVPVSLRLALSPRHVRELAGFAGPILFSNVMSWGSGQLPRLFLGVYLGAAELGLFSTAGRFNALVKSVAMVPKSFVARLDLRRFAADHPDLAPTDLAPAARRVFQQIGLLAFPICCGGTAVMPAVFHAWLDARWYGAILPAQIMLLGCIPYATFYGVTAVLYALNLQATDARVSAVMNVGIVAGMAAAARFGLAATSLAVAGVPLLLMPLPILAIARTGRLAVRDILQPQVPALLAAAAMGGAVALLRVSLAPALPDLAALPILIAAGGLLYPLLVAALMPGEATRMLDRFRGRR